MNKEEIEKTIDDYYKLYIKAKKIADSIIGFQKFHHSVDVSEVSIEKDDVSVRCEGSAWSCPFTEWFTFPTSYLYTENYFELEKIRQEEIKKQKELEKQKEKQEALMLQQEKEKKELSILIQKYGLPKPLSET